MYVNISKNLYFDKFMSRFKTKSRFRKNMLISQTKIDISINLCQDFKKCQYFDKFMSIFQKNVNISPNSCQYFEKM